MLRKFSVHSSGFQGQALKDIKFSPDLDFSTERTKRFKQNSDNFMKIGFKIKKIWNCKVSQFWKFSLFLLSKHVKCPHIKIYQSIHHSAIIQGGYTYCMASFILLIAEIWDFCHIYAHIEWKFVRWWHHQLTYLHIHIECSRNVSWKIAKPYNFISSLFLIWFLSNCYCSVWNLKKILSIEWI